MEKKKLGKSNIEVYPIAFGGNVFGWTINEKISFELLDAFVSSGFNFIDTADAYSYWVPGNKGGESETIIGNWLKQRGGRDKIVIATKVGGETREHGKNLTKKYIIKTAEESLSRLQTDYIDLYQTHWDDNITPVEETLSAYEQLIKEGKVLAVGASNLSPERLIESLRASEQSDLPRYESFQPCYNLYDREDYETLYEKICVENNLGVICYYSLASGFLTGKYRSLEDIHHSTSARAEGIKNYLTERGYAILRGLDKIAKEYHTSQATIALAWLMSKPSITAPIASATTPKQLKAITDALDIHLSEEAVKFLDNIS